MREIKPRIYLPIETKRREFHSRVFFATQAVLKNWSVVICSKQDFFSKYKLLQPGVIMLKSLQSSYHEIMIKLKKDKFKFVAVNEEGLLFIHPNFILNKVNQKCLDEIEQFFCWGEMEKNILIEKFKDIESKLILSGNARIDILKKNNRKALENEAKEIKKNFGNFILFTTKFGRVNFIPRFGIKSWLEGQFLNGNINKKQNNYLEFTRKSIEHEKNNLDFFFKFLENFHQKFPEKKLVIRPHPSENHEVYINEVNKYNNISVISDDKSTNSWIIASEFLIHCNCTTSIEAYFLNKSSVNFLCYSNEKVEHKLPKIFSKNVYTIQELLEKISNPQEKINLQNNEYDIAKKWLFNLDNVSSPDVILKNLIQLKLINGIYKDKNSNIFYFLYYKFKRLVRNILYKYFDNNDKGYRQLINQKMANYNKTEIQDTCKSYTSEEEYKKIKVREIYPDIFEIVNDKN